MGEQPLGVGAHVHDEACAVRTFYILAAKLFYAWAIGIACVAPFAAWDLYKNVPADRKWAAFVWYGFTWVYVVLFVLMGRRYKERA